MAETERASWWMIGDSEWGSSEGLRRRRTSWWAVGEDGVGKANSWRAVGDGYGGLAVEQHQRGLRLLVVAGLVGR